MNINNHDIAISVNDEIALHTLPEPTGRSRSRSRSRNNRNASRSRSSSHNRTRRDIELSRRDATPLLPEDALPRPKPPTRGPEIDEDDSDGRDSVIPTHGIDDGFFDDRRGFDDGDKPNVNGNKPRRGSVPAVFPHPPPSYGGPGILDNPRIIPDINVYQHKKTLAQGMMDLALLSANANQLRYVIEAKERHPYYLFSMTFIIASLVFQVLVGIGLVLNSRYNVKNEEDICKADRINNLITVAILLVTIINVFISAFGVAEIRT